MIKSVDLFGLIILKSSFKTNYLTTYIKFISKGKVPVLDKPKPNYKINGVI